MQIIHGIPDLAYQRSPIAIALGTFDGVHKGHQLIIRRVVEKAKEISGTSVVFTFDPHPLAVIKPEICPPLITTLSTRAELIAQLGVDLLVVAPFSCEIARLSPESFVREILLKRLGVKFVSIGSNYTYGYRGLGDASSLVAAGYNYQFTVEVAEPVYINGIFVSSTIIRQLIQEGKVDQAAELLGRVPFYRGYVIPGDGRGRNLGFPTANLTVDNSLVSPADGVYAVKIVYDFRTYPGIADIGYRPTFRKQQRGIEIFIFDFEQNLYGKEIEVQFIRKLRNEIAFPDQVALVKQIEQDILQARKLLMGIPGMQHNS